VTVSEAPLFRFHPNAYDLGAFEAADGVCDACGERRALRYTSSIYARERPGFVCPWCVADGTAARVFDGEFSDAAGIDDHSLVDGVEVATDAAEAEEVATRTPSYVSWQQEQWRAHCGRPCAFIGDIGAGELARYAHEPDFAADLDGGLGWEPGLLRTHLTAGGDLAGYLFRCLTCGAHRLHVDAS
jgi:uncharacterized protein